MLHIYMFDAVLLNLSQINEGSKKTTSCLEKSIGSAMHQYVDNFG